MNPPAERVLRFDVASLGATERTPQGFLRAPANVTRVGVFAYRRADGTTIREFRPAEEVFAPASLATLAAAPVTDLHPSEMVTPANVRRHAIGHLGEQARRDGNLVVTSVTVQDQAVIEAVEAGKRREVSMGYRCRIDATPGTFEGEPYDVVQRDIVYNHAALGPRNWGRAGREVALRLDQDDDAESLGQAYRLDASAGVICDAPERRGGDDIMDLTNVRVDGLDVQVPKQWGQVIEKALSQRDDSIKQLTAARDTLQAKFDTTAAELEDTKKKLAEASDPKRLDSAVNERAALLESARKFLGDEFKFDGLTPRQVHEAALLKYDSKLELKGKSDEYVAARFDAILERFDNKTRGGNNDRNDALDHARRFTSESGRKPESRQDSPPPYKPEWQQPLATSKDRH